MLNKTNKKMKKVRAAIVGYGNIGRYVLEALQAAPDFEIAGVVRRAGAENKPAELNDYAVVKDIKELQGVDVAILCTPTRSVEKYAKEILAMGINTVDSFDIHTGIVDLRRELGACAKEHGAVSIISAEGYNLVCEFLGANWYALVATLGLAALFVIHIIYAFWLTIQNRAARGSERYAVVDKPKTVEWASQNMLVLGIIVILGLGLHLFNFWAKMQLPELVHNMGGVANG